MHPKTQRVSGNRLVRRLRRHANLTTLFRVVDPTLGLPSAATPESSASSRLVQAQLVQLSAIESPSQPAQRPAEPALMAQVTPSVAPGPAPLPPSAAPATEGDDPNWRRLQAIFHKHQPEVAQQQPLPLQAVWPVQREDEPESPAQPGPPSTPEPAVSDLIGSPDPTLAEPSTSPQLAQLESPVVSDQEVNLARVATDIGPLPSDLWQLLGQPLPEPASPAEAISPEAVGLTETEAPVPRPNLPVVQTKAEPMGARPAREATVSEPVVPEAGAAEAIKSMIGAASGERPAEKARPTVNSNTIQQETMPSEVGITSAPIETGGSAAAQKAPADPIVKIDTDELARRVYTKLKNRLAIEWERVQRR
jgi:hypothetical protein